ncbi:MAG: GLPGLI family protein [Phocaeicola sp.]|uniref:GLPGLI family protein n=1 Tax=Phocaeicola TaxID=909656 RepID=UPI00234EFF2C|nr:GLPGLI family protein [Phocaeicola oris]MCE2616003.1 GLPGLI family protein [Phocaeicola oris]
MKKILFIMAFACFLGELSAQTIEWNKSNSNVQADSIAKKILEPSQYLITYAYRFVRDANYPNDKRTGMTILQVGKHYNRFWDYNELRFDSICDELSQGKMSMIEASPLMLAALKKNVFTESILIDKQKNKEIIQRTAGLLTKKYQYEEDCPKLEWEVLKGDTTIAGYHCNKAKTRLFGRDYIAWYSTDVNMPYGPYKFNGLPGLVFCIMDTQGHFEFTLNGLQKANKYTPIYLWNNKNIVKTNRKTVREIYKNYCADPVGALTSDGSIQIPDDVKATVAPKPYNPIELE